MKKTLAFLFSILTATSNYAQESANSLVQNPASLRWSAIQTPHFRVIFPSNIAPTGLRTANVLEHIYVPVSQSLGKKPRPISVILQNQNSVSNGFVTLLPRRSEFYITPPQDPSLLGNNHWLDLLAVHEFRHVVQLDKAYTGIGKPLYWLFGNNSLGLLTSLVTPSWFKEGDAVGTETALTPSGRGKIPSFDMALRGLLTDNAPPLFSYSKSVGRSFKDYVPNHYVYGYFLTTYLKNHYGIDVWDKILANTFRFPLYPFSFSHNIKKYTGLSVEQLYQNAIAEVQQQWKTEQANLQLSASNSIPSTVKYYTNYLYPNYLANGKIVALKAGLAHIESLVLLDKNKPEQKIIDLGMLNDANRLSVQGNKVVWAEFEYDPRWGQRNYSVIKMYDFDHPKIQTLTHKTKYAAPALSPDGTQIACVETSPENQVSLVILEASTGKVINKIPNPTQAFYLHPTWSDTGELLAVQLLNNQKTVVAWANLSATPKVLFQTEENISNIGKKGSLLWFNSTVTGIDNVFALDLATQQRYQVTQKKLGASYAQLSPDGKEILFDDFTRQGYRVNYAPFDLKKLPTFQPEQNTTTRYFGQLRLKEAGEKLLANIPDSAYAIKPYHKYRLIHPYSWGMVLNSTGSNLLAGVSSQDLLSTTALSAGYGYNTNEQQGQFYTDFSFQAWYPIIDINYTNGNRRTDIYIDSQRPLDSLRSDVWQQQQLNLGLRLPFNLTRSKYIRSMSLASYISLTQVSGYDLNQRYISESFNGLNKSWIASWSFTRQLKTASRDLAPRLAQSLFMYYRKAFDSNIEGGLFAIQGSLFLPGLAPHHSLRLRGAYQYQMGIKDARGVPNNRFYSFGSPVFVARGYSYRSYENLTSFSIDYRMPLADIDWTLGRLAYIKRLKTNLFADFSNGSTYYYTLNRQGVREPKSEIGNFTTFGIDFSAQFNLFRFAQTFEAGIRFVYLPNNQQFLLQPLVIDIGF